MICFNKYLKMDKGKIVTLICCGVALLVWLFIYLSISSDGKAKRSYKGSLEPVYGDESLVEIFEGEKIVHLDLKGAPPKISYIYKFFNLVKLLGATGVIIEYEDMFPYSNGLENISANNAYKMAEIKQLNNWAKELNLNIMPLVQTFGHLEFLLKNQDFMHLREIRKYPQVICPSHEKSLYLLTDMINQVISAHPRSKAIHIGADEVYLLGQCPKCFNRILDGGISKETFFLTHITNVASRIKGAHPHLRILMWDDQLRKVKYNELIQSGIAKYVEPVIWSYVQDVNEQIGPEIWNLYSGIFDRVWVASAFKGATGSNKYITDINYHLQNHRSWMKIVNRYKKDVSIQGIILTGWQRYDHFAVLCELLPIGIPSLALCLHHLDGITMSPFSQLLPYKTAAILQCKNPYGIFESSLGLPKCQYPGSEILDNVLKVHQLTKELDTLMDSSVVRGWLSDFNMQHHFSNVYLIESTLDDFNMLRMELLLTEKELRANMQLMYDNNTTAEWIDTYLAPIYRKIQPFLDAKNNLLDKDVWPKKPLTNHVPYN